MIAVLTILTTIFLITFILRQRTKRPPGPFPWPFIGNRYYLEKLTRQFGGQHLAFMEMSKMYNSGVISLQLGNSNVIVVTDIQLIREVCLNEKFNGRPWNEFIKMRNMGLKKGITLNDGEEWKETRSWSIRALRSVGFAKQAMIELIMEEITLIVEKLADGGVRRIQPVFAPTVINVLWMMVTGRKPSENPTRLQKFIDLLDRRSEMFDLTGGTLVAFPWLRYIAPEMCGYNILVTLNNELKSFLMDSINEHKKRYVKGSEADFIDLFLKEMYNDTEAQQDNVSIFSDDNLLVTLIDLFMGGIGITTSTLDIPFLQIANHQDIQRKLHEEIDTVIGPHRLPKLEDKIKMPYTEAILTECQRIWNVVPLAAPRRVLSDTILGDYKLSKNSVVLMNTYSINMDPDSFPDPTTFRPERYITENGTYQAPDNIMLFGKGKRRCPGEAMARSIIFLLFVGIMQKFRLFPVPGKGFIKMESTFGVLVSPKPYEMLIVPK